MSSRWVALFAALACVCLPARASAHLMQAQHATLNVVDTSVFSVVSIPASALVGVDDDGDGLVSESELGHHLAALKAQLAARWTLRDGADEARLVRLDVILQPADEAPTDRAAHIVMLHHARFAHAPTEVELETDLFGTTTERSMTASATREKKTESEESAVLTPAEGRHAFFAPPIATGPKHLGWDIAGILLLVLVTLRLTREKPAPRAPDLLHG